MLEYPLDFDIVSGARTISSFFLHESLEVLIGVCAPPWDRFIRKNPEEACLTLLDHLRAYAAAPEEDVPPLREPSSCTQRARGSVASSQTPLKFPAVNTAAWRAWCSECAHGLPRSSRRARKRLHLASRQQRPYSSPVERDQEGSLEPAAFVPARHRSEHNSQSGPVFAILNLFEKGDWDVGLVWSVGPEWGLDLTRS